MNAKRKITMALVAISLNAMYIAPAAADFFGPPPPGDPSAYTGPFIGDTRDLEGTVLPNEGAFEGGLTGTETDAGADNSVPVDQQILLQTFVIPSNTKPSPTFHARPFTQPLLRFEEFGAEPLDPLAPPPANGFPVPAVGPLPEQDPLSVARSNPSGVDLENFLAQPGIAPFPTEFSNTLDLNPWQSQIEDFLGRPLNTPPAEGRPPGQGWAHQRWTEFQPQAFFKTAQAGSRVNNGFRDPKQLHHWNVGEWGPGGLYHNPTRVPGAVGNQGLGIRFHPNMPVQDHQALWTFDGTLPPKLLMVRYGQGMLMRHYNALPIDPAANHGFGLHTITTHEHNGHSPAESDGYTNAFFFPGQFYDYRWPIQLAGYDTVNTSATNRMAAFPCSPGETLFVNDANPGLKTCPGGTGPERGKINIRGDWKETMSTHWFHDHMLDFTAQNVYKGNAVMMNYYSAIDRGKEDFQDGVNLRFPSGTALDWGNRDYDVNLLFADKAWDQNGQLWFNIFNLDGFLGDQILTNWLYKPFMQVRARSYRFRILNGSVSRYLKLAFVQEKTDGTGELPGPAGSNLSYNRVPFYMIANDGNIMEHTVPFDGTVDLNGDGNLIEHKGQLPEQGIAERYDIIIDFSKNGIKPKDKIYVVNMLEHRTGRKPNKVVPLADILSKAYNPKPRDDDGDGIRDRWIKGDPGVGMVMQFRVRPYKGVDLSMNPANYLPGGKTMIPLTIHRDDPVDQAKLANAVHHTFEFARSNGTDNSPWTIKTDGGRGFNMDPRRISVAPMLANAPTPGGTPNSDGTLQIWHIKGNGGWSHPVHIHFEEGIILTRGRVAPPEWETWARKDLYRIGPLPDSTDDVEIAIHFREFAGTFMEHCHNTQHEDHSMLLRWDIEHPGQVTTMPAPMPTWDGVEYLDSEALPDFRTGDGLGPVN